MEKIISTPSYICQRWFDGDVVKAYLLISIDPNPEPRANLHHHLDAGYFALWINGEWVVRCHNYVGFNLGEAISDNALRGMLPPGAVLPTWRLKPPRITVKRLYEGVEIRWDNKGWFDSKRVITWADGVVRVVDRWSLWGKKVREWRV